MLAAAQRHPLSGAVRHDVVHDGQKSRHPYRGALYDVSAADDQRLVQYLDIAVQSQIATNMQSCASPGLYFAITTDGDISAAMQALFEEAVSTARLTN